jgi:LAO/AO transport system kinase
LNNKETAWKPPVLKTVALTGEGVPQIIEKIEEHRLLLEKGLKHKGSREKAEAELIEAIKEKVVSSVLEGLRKEGKFEQLVGEIVEREIDPASAAEKLLKKALKDAEA